MGLTLKIKMPDGQQVVQNLAADSTFHDLKCQLSLLGKISFDNMDVLRGFPPLPLEYENETSLVAAGILSGDTLILKKTERRKETTAKTETPEPRVNLWNTPSEPNGRLMKRTVPADNSCLFSSIYYALNGKLEESSSCAPLMRQTVAEEIASNEEYYNAAFLGDKSNSEYCNWIQNENSWGGAIELSILSNYHETEIIVLDSINAILNRFGEDKNYSQRILLLFDGIHYDPVCLEIEGQQAQTIFSTQNESILQDAQLFVNQVKSDGQYTDMNRLQVKCVDCNIILDGQVKATQHFKTTGHNNFKQIKLV